MHLALTVALAGTKMLMVPSNSFSSFEIGCMDSKTGLVRVLDALQLRDGTIAVVRVGELLTDDRDGNLSAVAADTGVAVHPPMTRC